MSQIFNESIEATNFPNELKHGDITPVYKKNNRHEKENYRPVSIISVIFKILERCLYDQIYKNIGDTLSRHQMGYRKGCSSQHSLIAMFGKWKENLDKGGEYRDLSKAFDCLQDDLLLAKLNAYGFDYKFIKLISSFLSSRKYRTKINSHFSKWKHLVIAVTQGSVLGPLIFNICMCDLSLFMSEFNVENYVDDTTLYACEKNLHDLQRKLEPESFILLEWFYDNYLKANSGKSHVMLATDDE